VTDPDPLCSGASGSGNGSLGDSPRLGSPLRDTGRVIGKATLVAAVALVATACSGDDLMASDVPTGSYEGELVATYDGPLYLSPDEAEHREAGAAGDFVECRTWGDGGFFLGEVYTEGATAKSAERAVENGRSEGAFAGGSDGLTEAAREDDRVLFVVEVDGVPKQAVVVHDGPAAEGTGGDGWYVESWARCDYSELSESFTEEIGLLVWYDEAGEAVPTTELEVWRGPEHCDWQSMTFVYLDDETYVGQPQEWVTEYLADEYAADVPLPKGAEDLGFEREGRHMWRSSDKDLLYVGTPESVEAWPRSTESMGCD
jgi:hypothetical protein